MPRPRPVLLVDKKTGEVVERFLSAYEAQDAVRGEVSVTWQLYQKALGNRRCCYRFEDDFDPMEDWERKKNRPVWIVDMETGRIGWAVNAPEAAKVLGVTKQFVYDAARNGYVVKDRHKVRLQRNFREWSLLKERMEHEVPQG